MPRAVRIDFAAALAVMGALAPVACAQAQTAAQPAVLAPTSLRVAPGLPRTADGWPDLQNVVWAANFFPVFEANGMAKTLEVPEADAQKIVATMVAGMLGSDDVNIKIDPEVSVILGQTDGLPLVRGERRTRVVVLPTDGKAPMTPEARKETASSDPLAGPLDNPEQRPIGERCLALNAPPMSATISYARFRIVQTRDFVVIHSESGDEARIIPLARAHQPQPQRRWLGDSIAHWEADTLVIETIGLPKENRLRGLPAIIVNDDATVIERLTRISDNELLYQYTVVDPKVYTAPWLAEFSFYRSATGMFPSPCHEGNYSLPNILKGARMAERRSTVSPNAGVK